METGIAIKRWDLFAKNEISGTRLNRIKGGGWKTASLSSLDLIKMAPNDLDLVIYTIKRKTRPLLSCHLIVSKWTGKYKRISWIIFVKFSLHKQIYIIKASYLLSWWERQLQYCAGRFRFKSPGLPVHFISIIYLAMYELSHLCCRLFLRINE